MIKFLLKKKKLSLISDSFKFFLKDKLGIVPIDEELYLEAITHSSFKNIQKNNFDNERLEYLGDAFISLSVAQYLFKLYPFKDEGFLTKIRSKIVNRESLNNIGRKIGLKNLINVKRFKSKSYDSIYGDALEAIIGACYLEKGFDFCEQKVIKNIIVPYFDLDNLTTQIHNFKSKVL